MGAGILLWSLGLIIEGKDLLGGLVFAILVNMKQLYAVLGPAYFVYLLRHHCRCDSLSAAHHCHHCIAKLAATSIGKQVL